MSKRIDKKLGKFKCICGANKTYMHIKDDNFRSRRVCFSCIVDEMFKKLKKELKQEN